MSGKTIGIGITIVRDYTAETIQISEVQPNSPAEMAGIMVGDYMIAVDGVSIQEIGLKNVGYRIKGEVGTSVNLTLLRGEEEITVTVTRKEIEEISQKNEQLSSAVTTATTKNEELTQKVQLAEKLTLTGVSLQAFNKKGKAEKKEKKAKTLGVSLTITPNNTAKPGLKDVYVRITSPEGNLLKGNGSFSAEGTQLEYTTKRQVEYANEELSTVIYWDVNTSLTAGEYTVEIFIDGNRLTSRRFTLN
jgi:hypothetical protein